MKQITTILAALFFCSFHVFGQIIHVPDDYPSIQAAIEAAVAGDTVLVEEGTYVENINFLGKAITVASRFILDGDTAHISKTIIDGSGAADPDLSSTVFFISGEDTTSVLMGLTITGGTGSLINTGSGFIDLMGGGIVLAGSGALITHNIIEENHIVQLSSSNMPMGAGIGARVDHNHTLIVRSNIVRRNSVEGDVAYAGGMMVTGGRIIVEGNQIINNHIEASGTVAGAGLGWANFSLQGTIQELLIRNNLISGNSGVGSSNPTGGGGGIFFGLAYSTGIPEIYNNIIANNNTASSGGGISLWAGENLVYNNTIYNNAAGAGGNHLHMNSCNATLFNNILWTSADNGRAGISFFPGNSNSLYASHNLLDDALDPDDRITSIGNLVADPVFIPESYELEEYSPGIGRGIDSVQLNKAWYKVPPMDFLGNPRPNPIDTLVDLGAIESPYEGNVFIPDTAFLKALIEVGVDTNEDSLISYVEAEAVTMLSFRDGLALNNMRGIEAFINLEDLYIHRKGLTSLDVSNNTALTSLDCGMNRLTSLDVSKNTALVSLVCGLNELASLDVSMNTALTYLLCSDNQLTSLDVSANTILLHLNCSNNLLTSLDVSKNIDLQNLECSNNQLTSLDISHNTHLFYATPGHFPGELDLSKMPSLEEVCVWQLPFPPEGIVDLLDTTGSPNAYFTKCSVSLIEKPDYSVLKIYPNPTYTLLTIETEQPDQYSIEITSLNGQQIFTGEMQGTSHQIDLSSFSKGAYFITIRSKDFVTTRKVIKL